MSIIDIHDVAGFLIPDPDIGEVEVICNDCNEKEEFSYPYKKELIVFKDDLEGEEQKLYYCDFCSKLLR